jgi:hypothetical protein
MGLAGILVGLGVLVWFAFRGWTVLLLAPAAALVAAAFAGEPLLAHWTQTFMESAARFLAQFFPIFLLGALFGKLMEDTGSVSSIADCMTERLGKQRAIMAVVLAGAIVTYGGVSVFVAFFVLSPMAQVLFRAADIPPADAGRRRPWHAHLHHDRAAGHPRHSERHSDAVLRHHAVRSPRPRPDRLGDHADFWALVARPARGGGATGRRGFRGHGRP